MIDLLADMARNRKLIRGPLRELKEAADLDTADQVNNAIKFFDREDDTEQVLTGMKTRFAVGIDKEKNIDGSTDGDYEVYTRKPVEAQIDAGIHEALTTGIGPQIANSLTITTQPNQVWDYFISGEEDETGKPKKAEDAEKLISTMRLKGGFDLALECTDYISVVVESAAIHPYWAGRTLNYDCVAPSDIYTIYGDTITDDGIERAPSYTDIEDSSAVIIRLATRKGSYDGAPEDNLYLCYMGASEDQPDGRCCTYKQNKYWPVPAVGASNITSEYRHTEGGDICNPLTYVMNHGKGKTEGFGQVEYPIAIFRGGVRRKVTDLFPISTSLYNSCVELELAYSRILKSALENARGKDVFEFDSGANLTLPRSLDILTLKEGQHYTQVTPPSPQAGLDATVKIVKAVAGGFSVPGYQLLGQAMATPESGIALAIQTQPLLNFRDRRYRVNRTAIDRIFAIEKGILAEYHGDGAPIAANVEQSWLRGKWTPPRDIATETAAITAARDAELIDHIAAIKQYHSLATDAEAEALIEKYTERDPDYGKAPEPETPSPFGAP